MPHLRPPFDMSTTPYETLCSRAQACISKTPVVILGSGASVADGIPGMGPLREYLMKVEPPKGTSGFDRKKWAKFLSTLQNTDLESALQEVNLPQNLDDHVVSETWRFLQPYDINAFDRLLLSRGPGPLTRLFQHLLRSTHNCIDVVTPNYDRLAEYAADLGELYHETGFRHGHVRAHLGDNRQSIQINDTRKGCVNIWKVHGSLDWFLDQSQIVRALPISHPRPKGWIPAIVTPGLQKFRRTYDEPFVSIKSASDRAFSNASAFFCVGFGFNDSHIQTKLKERCRAYRVPLVLITHTVSATARQIIGGDHCQEYLAIEKADGGCKIFCSEYPNGALVNEGEFWQLDTFLKLITT